MATRFAGPVRTGIPMNASGKSTVGVVPAFLRVAVSADGPSAPKYLPECHIQSMLVNVETAWEGSAGTTTTVRFGTSGNATKYGSVVVSGVGGYPVTVVSGLALIDLSAKAPMIVDVTTVGTAGVGGASVYVQYYQLEP